MSGAGEGVAVNIGNSDLFRNETTARAKAFVEAMAIVNRDPFVALGILTTPPARTYAEGVADSAAIVSARSDAEDDTSAFLALDAALDAIRLLSQGEKA